MKRKDGAARRTVLVTSLLAAAGVLVWAGPPTAALRGTGSAAATPDAQGAALAATAAWVVLVWLVLSAVLSAAARLPGIAGRFADVIAGRIAPAAVRRIVEAALGVAVTASMASPAVALAGPPVQRPAVVRTVAGAPAGPHALQLGDRVFTSDSPQSAAEAPPVDFDRPGQGAVRPLELPKPQPPKSQPALTVVQGAVRAGDSGGEYVVRAGDSLWSIASRELGEGASAADVDSRWREWYSANRTAIGADPDLILPGIRLVAPDADSQR